MSTTSSRLVVLAAVSVLSACAANHSAPFAPSPMTAMEMDRQLVAQGSLPAAVLEIDAELEKTPPGSAKALELQKQKFALTQAQVKMLDEQMDQNSAATQERGRVIRELMEKEQAERARAAAAAYQQPQEEQRMCSVNNGSVTYLRPC
ncbi:hypothetical protein IAE35_12795 [Pseudomonas sp. S75]|uniref:hypothetical protein n=1 Tax=unclassified Pseudomonas TaxID=196821 RepID=UPI001907E704|nr:MULTISPECIES: hypothetical protein [unclassified Pseudomonas]MBJ9974472.1 hypothetical protein [Pseudomonas sp. S30]MBK0154219.1 hypothetical protein [Pseudomonas sp. S75]